MKRASVSKFPAINLAIIIPAHNEEEVIAKTLESATQLVGRKNVYVVNDGSKDKTAQIAKKYTTHVLSLPHAHGKATAINTGIKKFKLTNQYDYIMPVDADTVVHQNFVKEIAKVFQNDQKGKIACVIGKVVGRTTNWVTTYRLWEYEISQTIHKAAQSVIGSVIVCPGPSTVFRSKVFKKIQLPTQTLTEDMDFTFQIHRKKIGQIVYCPNAYVITQDPKTLKSFTKQISRWYKGFWQCLIKHDIPWGGQRLDVEVALLATEALFNGLLVISLALFIPLTILYRSPVLLLPLIIDLVFFLIPTLLYTAFKHHSLKILLYIPHFYFLRFVTSLVFLKSFIDSLREQRFAHLSVWNTARYKIRKEEPWPNPLLP